MSKKMTVIHREVTIRWPRNDSLSIVGAIADFCNKSPDYEYLLDKSMEYARHINADACIVHAKYAAPYPALSFATGDGANLHLTNIVPQTVSEIGIDIYNRFAVHFASCFRSFSKSFSPPIRIECTGEQLTLASVIPGKQTREFFQKYLNMYPTSHHPLDIERLDTFICAASAYCHRRIDTHRLHRYLTEVLDWTEKQASLCTNRIDTGFDILKVRKRF